MSSLDGDTIVARATPLGTGGIAVVRLSGSGATAIAGRLFTPVGYSSLDDMPVRFLANGTVAGDEGMLDQCLAVRFERPHSFTGEDVVELHLHGSMLINEQVIEACARLGARLATPGEFTRRAFLNGKIDLTQVEALADVIATESEQALLIAQRQLHGELRKRLEEFRKRVLKLLALLELELDFVQDGYRFAETEEVNELIGGLSSFVDRLLSSYHTGNRLRNGPRILLLGRPNAGKSSLFNALVGYARALVSAQPGTTRDYLEERISYQGVQFRMVDTAGLRSTADVIEAQGVARAQELAAVSDHIFYLIDGSRGDAVDQELAEVEELRAALPYTTVHVVCTKSDVSRREIAGAVTCSIFNPASVTALLDGLIAGYRNDLAEAVALVSTRQYHLLQNISDILQSTQYDAVSETELLSADLRALLTPLSELTGEVVNEDVLRTLFSSFCIGK